MGEIIDTIRPFVLSRLPYKRSDPDTVAALASKTIAELLVIYLNWQSRLIPVRPRTVIKSSQFAANPISLLRQTEIAALVREIESGADLRPRLSKDTGIGFTLPKSGKLKPLTGRNRPDLDMLLNDWSIHHLHIASGTNSRGRVKRGDPLVFGFFEHNAAYLIDIYDHRSWTARSIVETVVSNWPDKNLFLQLRGLNGPPNAIRDPFDSYRSALRNVGMSSPIIIDGKVYVGRSLLTGAGTTSMHSHTASLIMRALKIFEDLLANEPETIRTKLSENGVHITGKLSFVFCLFAEGAGVIETSSGTNILLN